jgi:hypothetical protein
MLALLIGGAALLFFARLMDDTKEVKSCKFGDCK